MTTAGRRRVLEPCEAAEASAPRGTSRWLGTSGRLSVRLVALLLGLQVRQPPPHGTLLSNAVGSRRELDAAHVFPVRAKCHCAASLALRSTVPHPMSRISPGP